MPRGQAQTAREYRCSSFRRDLTWEIDSFTRRMTADIVPRAAHAPLRELFVGQWDRLLLTIGAVAASTSSQYILVYMPTYAIRELNLPQSVGFTAAVLAAALQTLAVPFVGIWVDKVGQTRVMI